MGLLTIARAWSRDIAGMIWPRTCEICGCSLVDGEQMLCLHCLAGMPRTNLHHSDFNSIHHRLAGSAPVERAGAFMLYTRGGAYSGLIRRGKYNGRPDILCSLARIYATELLEAGFFEDIDMLLPVPMHWMKKLKRGYNQSEIVAEGISCVTGIPLGDNIVAHRPHATQTHRSAFDRYTNVAGIFRLIHPEELRGRHVALVDDVITTGSTLLSCLTLIHTLSPDTKVSIITLGSAGA